MVSNCAASVGCFTTNTNTPNPTTVPTIFPSTPLPVGIIGNEPLAIIITPVELLSAVLSSDIKKFTSAGPCDRGQKLATGGQKQGRMGGGQAKT